MKIFKYLFDSKINIYVLQIGLITSALHYIVKNQHYSFNVILIKHLQKKKLYYWM